MRKILLLLVLGLLFCITNQSHANALNTLQDERNEKIAIRGSSKSKGPERSGTYYIIYAELDSEEARLVIPLPDDFGEASIRIVRCADEAVMQTCTADAAAGKVTLRVDYAPGSYRIELESDAYTGEGHFTLP